MKRLMILGIIVVCALLTAADLYFHGLLWQFAYDQTGEERPVGQLRGLVEVAGNLIRTQPQTAPLVPIQHTDQAPYGVNVFLQKEVEEPKIRAMLTMIRDAGFVWLRQEFPWEDLEIDGRGQFTDSRNDYSGDGVPDTIDAWTKYDQIVHLTAEYGLQMMVRLSNPPDWAIADNPTKGTFAPPDDLQDYVNYATAVATRYKGSIHTYQIWNEPNIYPEWGEQFADPRAYTDMLCRTYAALKAVDPTIIVVSAAIAPTISLDGYQGYQDVVYLQNMYDAGAGKCFDVLSAQGYGLFSGAYDRRMRTTTVNVARHTAYRDIMVQNGDAAKPIWISEAAWNAVESAALPADQIADFERFGLATQDEAARWMPQLYQRAQEEWAWVGTVFYWFFTRPDPSEQGQSFYYFRMVEPDYSPDKPTFTPLPVYTSVKNYITQQVPTLYRGVHQAQSWQISSAGTVIEIRDAQFADALSATSATFDAFGTGVTLRYQSDSPIAVQVGESALTLPAAPVWSQITVADALTPQVFRMTLTSPAPFLLDNVTVINDSARLRVLVILAGAFAGMVVITLGHALWRRLGAS